MNNDYERYDFWFRETKHVKENQLEKMFSGDSKVVDNTKAEWDEYIDNIILFWCI
jgi:hypothetical protein